MQPKSTTALGKTLEDRVAKDYNGTRSVSSGAAAGRKGDVRFRVTVFRDRPYDGEYDDLYDFLAECKVTRAKSFTLKKDVWDKTVKEAHEAGLRPTMFIRFFDEETGKHIDLVVRDVNDDLEMIT